MNQREAFEKWASKPPMEFYLARHDDTAAWPGNYKDYHVECAWQAWQAATAIEREACAKVCDYYATAIDLRGNEYIRSGDCKRAAELIRNHT